MPILILMCLGGIILIVCSIIRLSIKPVITGVIGCLFIIIGISMYLLSEDIVTDDLGVTILMFICCYSFSSIFGFGVYINIKDLLTCNQKTTGVLTNINEYHCKSVTEYTLSFQFTANGISHLATTAQSFSKRKLKKLTLGQVYPIYISNDENPRVIYKKKLTSGAVCMLFFSLILLFIPFAVMFHLFE